MLGNLDCTSKHHKGGRRGAPKASQRHKPRMAGQHIDRHRQTHVPTPCAPPTQHPSEPVLELTPHHHHDQNPSNTNYLPSTLLLRETRKIATNQKCLPQSSTKSTRKSAPWARSSRLLARKVPATMSSSRYVSPFPISLPCYPLLFSTLLS